MEDSIKTAAVIAEYNPFHSGHLYHLERTRELTGASRILVVMSGCFVQRGLPAISDAHVRARMALEYGASAVLELPVFYSTASAQHFAMGAVSLLESLRSVDYLSFGSECGDLALLSVLAELLSNFPPDCDKLLKAALKKGLSYPAARSASLESYLQSLEGPLPSPLNGFTREALTEALSSPNDILGIEYLKALRRLNSRIAPVAVPRKGTGYHDTSLAGIYPSAAGIRKALEMGSLPLENAQDTDNAPMPSKAVALLAGKPPVVADDFSSLLHYQLLLHQAAGYTGFADVSRELSDRIANNLELYVSYSGFAELLKTRGLTQTRISRALLHILLNITDGQMERYTGIHPWPPDQTIRPSCLAAALDTAPDGSTGGRSSGASPYVCYARLLGFRRDSVSLLSHIKKNSAVPLISKLADAKSLLPPDALAMLRENLCASHIYGVAAEKKGRPVQNEYRRPLAIINS